MPPETENASTARALLRRVDSGVLSTMSVELLGYPFGSITPFVVTHEGRVVIYISEIAQHTKNREAEKREDDRQRSFRISPPGARKACSHFADRWLWYQSGLELELLWGRRGRFFELWRRSGDGRLKAVENPSRSRSLRSSTSPRTGAFNATRRERSDRTV